MLHTVPIMSHSRVSWKLSRSIMDVLCRFYRCLWNHIRTFFVFRERLGALKIVYGNYAPSQLHHCLFIVDRLMSIAWLSGPVIDLLSQIVSD